MQSKLIWLLGAFGICIIFFILTLSYHHQFLSPNASLKRLHANNSLLEIKSWDLSIYACNTNRPCELVWRDDLEMFPDAGKINKIVAKSIQSLDVTTDARFVARIEHVLSKEDEAWLKQKKVIQLILPRSLQNSVTLLDFNFVHYGALGSVSFSCDTAQLIGFGSVRLDFDFTGYSSFGPMELPIAAVFVNDANEYGQLPMQQLFSGRFLKQILLAFPVLIAGMALVFDHLVIFQILAAFGAIRACRSFLPLLFESVQSNIYQNLYVFVCGLSLGLLWAVVIKIFDLDTKRSRKYLIPSVLIIGCVFVVINIFNASFFFVADLWADGFGALLVVPAMAHSILLSYLSQKKGGNSPAKTFFVNSFAIIWNTRLLLCFVLSVTAYANFHDLFIANSDKFKDFFDWKHTILFPGLITAALIEVGSVSKYIKKVIGIVEQKAHLDEELKLAKDYQRMILPAPQTRGEVWEWRSCFKPATELAGDWFDVREIKFSDGNVLLFAAIADVTGHGTRSALVMSIVSAAWGAWCLSLAKQVAPNSDLERESYLMQGVLRVHEALVGNRQESTATGVFLIVDSKLGRLTFINCAHPFLLLVADSSEEVKNLKSKGVLLGKKDSLIESSVVAKTEEFISSDTLILLTDGILPPEQSSSAWLMGLKREAKKRHQKFVSILYQEMRKRRTAFRADKSAEDDITIVMCKKNRDDNV